MDLLCSILPLERSRHARARRRRAAAGGVEAVHLLEVARGAVLGEQPEPCHGRLAELADLRVRGGGDARVLGAGGLAQLHGGGVEVEEGGGGGGEEVLAADDEVGGREALRGERQLLVAGQVEAERDARQDVEDVRVGRRDAAGVEEGGDGADGHGGGGRVGHVAGVVLRAAADGDVLEGEAGCGWWESASGFGKMSC